MSTVQENAGAYLCISHHGRFVGDRVTTSGRVRPIKALDSDSPPRICACVRCFHLP